MKIIRRILLCGLALVASFYFVHAQTTTDTTFLPVMTDPNEDVSNLSDLEVELKALEMATPIAASNEPSVGNFYSAQHAPGSAVEWPPLPGNIFNLPVWPLDTNIFVLDDLNFNYGGDSSKMSKASSGTSSGMLVRDNVDINPGDGGDDTNAYNPPAYPNVLPDYGTNLYISQWGMVSNILTGIATNTLANVEYEIQTNSTLTTTNWVGTGQFILGSDATNWTQFILPPPPSTNNLFFRLQSWASGDDSGLPTWWELAYFGTNVINPNAQDGAGDGWTIYQKFEMGVNPNQFVTPPAPQGVTVSYDANTATATISWLPSPGSVTGYTVKKVYIPYIDSSTTNNFTTTATSYTNSVATNQPNPWASGTITVSYSVQANYAGGNSAWSAAAPLEASTFDGSIGQGAQGTPFLVVSEMPSNTTAIELTEINESAVDNGNYAAAYVTNIIIPISSFTNGICALTNIQTTAGDNCAWVAQALGPNGVLSASSDVSDYAYADEGYSPQTNWMVTPFYDERAELKQNLIFQLRAATVNATLNFSIPSFPDNGQYGPFGAYFGQYSYPTNYVYAGFYQFANPAVVNVNYGSFDFYLPFEENYLFRNLVFSTADANTNGGFTNAWYSTDGYPLALNSPPTYGFQTEAHGTTFPDLLTTNNTSWLFYDTNSPGWNGLLSVATDDSTYYNLSLPAHAYNWFGLPYVAANVVYQLYNVNNGDALGLETDLLSAGSTLSYSVSANENKFYSVLDDQNIYFETAQPQFQTVEYIFWNANPFFNTESQSYTYPILPGNPAFSPTNQSQLLLTTVGNDNFQVAGYAKLAVTNSVYTGVYGFLQQCFTNAYEINTNGNVTTNIAGVLSPYGNFLATQPGPAALVTMPDINTGQQGTCTVYAVSLQLDANHDGTMNLSYNGSDTTSPNSPYVFWANNNYDRWTLDEDDNTNYMDDVQTASNPGTSVPEPDCNYSNAFVADGSYGISYRAIPCTRDLEDFARLWVCGVTSNLLAALPTGSTITLSWGDVGNPNSANPTIDLFQAADSNGGIGYLTNATIAAEQTNVFQCPYIGRLGPGQSIHLNTDTFANNWAGNYFIWCGVSNGTGGLILTIADANNNVLAQTTAYIQIVDIKQMYERWTVGDNPNVAPTNVPYLATENLPPFTPAFEYTPPQGTNTPYILLVHGWNDPTWAKDRFAETAFKRLYWQGYQGRFGEFRWPTTYLNPTGNPIADDAILASIYDPGENNAWNSAAGLLNLLETLHATYGENVYMLAHSMGNVVAGEALRKAAQQGLGQLINTYVASQGAVPGHCYDSALSGSDLLGFDGGTLGPTTANIYNNWLATNSTAAGRRINFYNTNDYALNPIHWQLDEELKPDSVIGIHPPYGYDGSPSDNPPLQNGFYGTSPPYIGVDLTLYLGNTSSVSNRYEITAFAAEPRSLAMGAIPDVLTLTASLNLKTIWPPDTNPSYQNDPYGEHFYHSAEFRGDSIQEWGYWNTLLFSPIVGFNISSP